MIVPVEQHTARHELICRSQDGALITVDPFVGCAIVTTDEGFMPEGDALVGRTFDMQDFWKHADGCYLCKLFTEMKHE